MKKEFVFNNQADELYPALQEMMSFIGSRDSSAIQLISSRCKVILTELLTNGIKHAVVAPTLFTITLDGHSLKIVKSGHGTPFLPDHVGKQDPAGDAGRRIVISSDPLSDLYVVKETLYRLRFGVSDHPITDDLQVEGLVEHFGLLLITKASDRFFYEFKPEAGLNVFSSVVLF